MQYLFLIIKTSRESNLPNYHIIQRLVVFFLLFSYLKIFITLHKLCTLGNKNASSKLLNSSFLLLWSFFVCPPRNCIFMTKFGRLLAIKLLQVRAIPFEFYHLIELSQPKAIMRDAVLSMIYFWENFGG
jgi:hypothetical protein